MHVKPRFGDVQIIAGQQRVHGGIVVNAFDGVVILIVRGCINSDAVVFAHEPFHECGIQQVVAHHIKIVRTG